MRKDSMMQKRRTVTIASSEITFVLNTQFKTLNSHMSSFLSLTMLSHKLLGQYAESRSPMLFRKPRISYVYIHSEIQV